MWSGESDHKLTDDQEGGVFGSVLVVAGVKYVECREWPQVIKVNC